MVKAKRSRNEIEIVFVGPDDGFPDPVVLKQPVMEQVGQDICNVVCAMVGGFVTDAVTGGANLLLTLRGGTRYHFVVLCDEIIPVRVWSYTNPRDAEVCRAEIADRLMASARSAH